MGTWCEKNDTGIWIGKTRVEFRIGKKGKKGEEKKISKRPRCAQSIFFFKPERRTHTVSEATHLEESHSNHITC
jgi:hypothetical protein